MMPTLVAAAMLVASVPAAYDCTITHQGTITATGLQANAEVTFPTSDRDNWRFGLRVVEGRSPSVTVDWPANPIQIAGSHPTLPLAPGQTAFMATSEGPCMFTEAACVALVELSARDDGGLDFSILPAGSSRNPDGSRSLLHVVFVGTCRRHSGAVQ